MAGTITLQHYTIGNVRKVVATCVADAADGSFPDTVLPSIEGRLLSLATIPGDTAPDANYDVEVEDQFGHDVLEGVGANRSDAATEKVPVVYTGSVVHPVVDGSDTLTLKISGNTTNSAAVVVELYYALGA